MVAVMDPGDFMVDNHAVENPISVFADSVAGTLVVLVASLVAIIAMASMALAGVLSSSRFLYAMAKDGVLPAPAGRTQRALQNTPLARLGHGHLDGRVDLLV